MSFTELCFNQYQQELAVVKRAPFAVVIASLVIGGIGVFLFHMSMFAVISMKDSQLDTQEKEIGRLTKRVGELSDKELQGLLAGKPPTAESTVAPAYSPGMTVPLKVIVGKRFFNEHVFLDGYSYRNCTFENVTFVYNGGHTEMIDGSFKGIPGVKSSSATVQQMLKILRGIRWLKDNVMVQEIPPDSVPREYAPNN